MSVILLISSLKPKVGETNDGKILYSSSSFENVADFCHFAMCLN